MAQFTISKEIEVEVEVDDDDMREYFRSLDRQECRSLALELLEDCAEGEDIVAISTQLSFANLGKTIVELTTLLDDDDELIQALKKVIDAVKPGIAGQIMEHAMNRFHGVTITESAA